MGRDKSSQVPYVEHGKAGGTRFTITGTIDRADIPAVAAGEPVQVNDSTVTRDGAK